jgi:MYXO-CTERM domain-containing protein
VANWADWIKERTSYAASLIGATPPPWATGWPTDPAYSYPVGPPCEVVENCSSGLCIDGYCSRLCSPAAPCPSGYECEATSSICVELPAPRKKKSSSDDEGCSMATGRVGDATPPTPWVIMAAALSGLLGLRRRRRR